MMNDQTESRGLGDAEVFMRIRDEATLLYREQRPATYFTFMTMLAEIYNSLNPDNDYDLDIG